MKQPSDIAAIRHSLTHLLAAGVLEKFPDVKLGIGPVIENGFYYDFQFMQPISEEALPELEKMIIVAREKLIEQAKKDANDPLISQYLSILISLNKLFAVCFTCFS